LFRHAISVYLRFVGTSVLYFGLLFLTELMPIPMALEHWDRGFESSSRYGCMFACIFLSCPDLHRYRPCDAPIPRRRSPNTMSKEINSFRS